MKMLERGKMDRDAIEIVGIDSLIPQEHLLRKIDAAVDFNQLYEMVEPLYSEDNVNVKVLQRSRFMIQCGSAA